MIDLIIVTGMSKFLKNSILPHVDDFSALIHRYLLKYAILGLLWVQKREFGPKFRIGPLMIDFILVTGVPKFLKNSILPYVDDVSALIYRFLLKNALCS